MNLTNIQPDQAWQMALCQLQLEMSRASFDTWVKDRLFLSFSDGLLTIGTSNAFASEWLTDRLTSTVVRLLTGLLDQPVAVRFVAHESACVEEVEPDEESGASPEKVKPPEELTLQAEYQNIYDEIVQPEQVIVIPGYFLRYVPMLGVELAWLYVGFRQAAYEAGASNKPGKKVSAPARKVAYYAGMSPRSFWRWASRPATWQLLRWLVKPVEDTPKWNRGSDGRPHQATRNYRVAMSMPLTPFDERSLRTWLYRKMGERNSPLAVLQLALETRVEELLPWPEKMPSLEEITGEPHSVRDVVLEVCSPVSESERPQCNDLAERLTQYLMPSKDLVFLTHYFVSHWVARLGPGPAWFVAVMRDRCYLNQRTGEFRDQVRLEEGYAEAARWLGLKRVKTIWEWLRAEEVAVFLREVGRENGSWEEAPRRIKVNLGEPMTGEDRDLADAALAKRFIGAGGIHSDEHHYRAIGASCTQDDLNSGNAVGASGISGALDAGSAIGVSVTHSDESPEFPIGASCTDENLPVGASDTHSGATDSHRRGASVTLIGASGTLDWRECHSLNSLTPDFKHFIISQTTPDAGSGSVMENATCAGQRWVVAGDWQIGDLLARSRVSAKNQDQLLEKGVTAPAFISWLLYAASKGGSGIRDPVGQAVSRLAQDPTRGAGGAYDRLAAVPTNELADLIVREISGQFPGKVDWRTAMEGAPRARLRALADQLGLSVPDSNGW